MASIELLGQTTTEIVSEIVQSAYNVMVEALRKAAGSDAQKVKWVDEFFNSLIQKNFIGQILHAVRNTMRTAMRTEADIDFIASTALAAIAEAAPWHTPPSETPKGAFLQSAIGSFHSSIMSLKSSITAKYKGYGVKEITMAEVTAAPTISLSPFTGGGVSGKGPGGLVIAALAGIAAFFLMNK